ncbi:MAG: integrase arm-type DNA-binding domain-containing protein [Zoogloeaceae bacterium]|jgi:integrase|nr:integrase arm-type DNA-binding domain-containing protein [Zoogloeaceae bacterium]
MPIEKLTTRQLARISTPGKYGDGGGLYLQVTKKLVKSWVFRFALNGVEHYMGLGPFHAVHIREAREKARKVRTMLTQGVDPLQARETQDPVFLQGNKTFDDCVAEYIESHKAGWKNSKHLAQWKNSLLTYVSPCFGKRDVREIDTALVLQALTPIWETKTETAARLRERIARTLSFAATRGYREGDNPARWAGHLQELLPRPSRLKKVRHHPAIPYWEIAGFFRRLAEEKGCGAPALAFTILTAARTSEVLLARWTEMDFASRLWTVPAERMKSAREHRVPLSEAALAILRRQAGLHPVWVFPGKKSDGTLNASILRDTLGRMNRGEATVHGFRSSFRVWAAERTTYPKEVAELALAHKAGTQTEEAYQRSDLLEQRRDLLRDWALCCMEGVNPRP